MKLIFILIMFGLSSCINNDINAIKEKINGNERNMSSINSKIQEIKMKMAKDSITAKDYSLEKNNTLKVPLK